MIEKAKYSEMNNADFKIFSFQQRVSLHCGRFGHVLIIGCSLLTLWLSRLLSKLLILANRTQANTVITDLKYLFSRILISHKMFDILADLCNSRKTVPLGKKNQTISISLEDVILTTTEEFYPLYISTQFDCA